MDWDPGEYDGYWEDDGPGNDVADTGLKEEFLEQLWEDLGWDYGFNKERDSCAECGEKNLQYVHHHYKYGVIVCRLCIQKQGFGMMVGALTNSNAYAQRLGNKASLTLADLSVYVDVNDNEIIDELLEEELLPYSLTKATDKEYGECMKDASKPNSKDASQLKLTDPLIPKLSDASQLKLKSKSKPKSTDASQLKTNDVLKQSKPEPKSNDASQLKSNDSLKQKSKPKPKSKGKTKNKNKRIKTANSQKKNKKNSWLKAGLSWGVVCILVLGMLRFLLLSYGNGSQVGDSSDAVEVVSLWDGSDANGDQLPCVPLGNNDIIIIPNFSIIRNLSAVNNYSLAVAANTKACAWFPMISDMMGDNILLFNGFTGGGYGYGDMIEANSGQLPLGTNDTIIISNFTIIRNLSAVYYYSCAVAANTKAYAWFPTIGEMMNDNIVLFNGPTGGGYGCGGTRDASGDQVACMASQKNMDGTLYDYYHNSGKYNYHMTDFLLFVDSHSDGLNKSVYIGWDPGEYDGYWGEVRNLE